MVNPNSNAMNENYAIPNPLNNYTVPETNQDEDEVSTTSSYIRRQSTGSFTVGSDSHKAISIITQMLETYNNMIESNTNTIKENAKLQDANFAAMRSTLESIIDAINGISQRALTLEETARENAEKLTAISSGIAAGNDTTVQGRLLEFQHRVEKNESDIAHLKDCVESTSESINIIEGRLGNLEGRVSNIERLLMRSKQKYQNDVAAKTA